MNSNIIKNIIQDSIAVKQKVLADTSLLETIVQISTLCTKALKQGNKLLFCGNGGSAADAQHISAELSGRFLKDRAPLFAEALHVNTSYLTAVANDYGYDEIYARLVRGKGIEGDILFGISTSGNSPNILKAFEVSKELGVITIGMTGATGGKLKYLADHIIQVPSNHTPRIQEAHILIGHIICELIEELYFFDNK